MKPNVPDPRQETEQLSVSGADDRVARERCELELFKAREETAGLIDLAADIAHNVNNLLLPIIILTEMTRDDLPPDSALRSNLNDILEAATKAAKLLEPVLVLGRQRETVVGHTPSAMEPPAETARP